MVRADGELCARPRLGGVAPLGPVRRLRAAAARERQCPAFLPADLAQPGDGAWKLLHPLPVPPSVDRRQRGLLAVAALGCLERRVVRRGRALGLQRAAAFARQRLESPRWRRPRAVGGARRRFRDRRARPASRAPACRGPSTSRAGRLAGFSAAVRPAGRGSARRAPWNGPRAKCVASRHAPRARRAPRRRPVRRATAPLARSRGAFEPGRSAGPGPRLLVRASSRRVAEPRAATLERPHAHARRASALLRVPRALSVLALSRPAGAGSGGARGDAARASLSGPAARGDRAQPGARLRAPHAALRHGGHDPAAAAHDPLPGKGHGAGLAGDRPACRFRLRRLAAAGAVSTPGDRPPRRRVGMRDAGRGRVPAGGGSQSSAERTPPRRGAWPWPWGCSRA